MTLLGPMSPVPDSYRDVCGCPPPLPPMILLVSLHRFRSRIPSLSLEARFTTRWHAPLIISNYMFCPLFLSFESHNHLFSSLVVSPFSPALFPCLPPYFSPRPPPFRGLSAIISGMQRTLWHSYLPSTGTCF